MLLPDWWGNNTSTKPAELILVIILPSLPNYNDAKCLSTYLPWLMLRSIRNVHEVIGSNEMKKMFRVQLWPDSIKKFHKSLQSHKFWIRYFDCKSQRKFLHWMGLSLYQKSIIGHAWVFLARNINMGSGCGSVGRAVASYTRCPRFESSHRQTFTLNICFLSTVMKNIKY